MTESNQSTLISQLNSQQNGFCTILLFCRLLLISFNRIMSRSAALLRPIIRDNCRHCTKHHLKKQPVGLGINILYYYQSTTYYYNTHYLSKRSYFTNTDQMKKSDPYAALGLSWGATATEIKEAYRNLARELHPDVSKLDPTEALHKFRVVKEAYDKLMNSKSAGTHRTDLWEEWSFAIWRSGDLIAQERTDVAGVSRKRPVKPAESLKRRWGIAALGHPDGRGSSLSGRDYLGSGEEKRRSSTVGTGQSKWVSRKKDYREWNPSNATNFKGSNNKLLFNKFERSRDEKDEPDEGKGS